MVDTQKIQLALQLTQQTHLFRGSKPSCLTLFFDHRIWCLLPISIYAYSGVCGFYLRFQLHFHLQKALTNSSSQASQLFTWTLPARRT